MSRSHVCVDLSLDPSGMLIDIGLISGCKLFTGVPGRTKFPVAPASAIASLLFVLVSDGEYAVSIVSGVWLLMIVVFISSSLSLYVASSANILKVICWVGYNEFTEVGSRFCLYILSVLDPVAPNRHPRHCFCFSCCFHLSCWSITQFTFRSCCDGIHPFPDPEPSGRVLCCAFIDAPDMVCALSLLKLGICVLFRLLGWNCHPVWSTPYPHD